jgi:hypothetical protein
MLRPERSIDHVEHSTNLRRTSMNNSTEDMPSDGANPFMTSGMTSPQNIPNSKHHYDHILPKTLEPNARTTVNFFKSVHHQSNNPGMNANISRDSSRGLGGGWNGHHNNNNQVIVEDASTIQSPPRHPSGNRSITEIPGLTYLQVKVSTIPSFMQRC